MPRINTDDVSLIIQQRAAELPGLMAASVCNMPLRLLPLMLRLSPLIMPTVIESVYPNGLPNGDGHLAGDNLAGIAQFKRSDARDRGRIDADDGQVIDRVSAEDFTGDGIAIGSG